MTQSEFDWLKLHIAVPPGAKICSAAEKFGSASGLFAAFAEISVPENGYDGRLISAIKSADDKKAEDIMEICRKNSWHIITPDSKYYPEKLRRIKDFPFALFCSGDIGMLVKEPKISVVGTRTPDDKALMATYTLACCLSSLDVVTVSGGAQGIDASVHEGSLTGNGGTISVLGTGLGSDYLPLNSFMRKRIEKNGLLVSEFLPFAGPTRFSFPRRNRIISALSDITVVAQSGERGGSLITADYALKQGRKIMCFDEDIIKSAGCTGLIKNGAEVFAMPGELLGHLNGYVPLSEQDSVYSERDLHNDGIKGLHIIKPSGMTPDSFALYNGITPAEAEKTAGYILKKSGGNVSRGENKKISSAKPEKEYRPEIKPAKKKIPEIPEKKPEKTENVPGYLSEEAKKVYAVLTKEPVYFDEIQFKTSLPVQDVMTAVTELELEDLALLFPGNRVGKS